MSMPTSGVSAPSETAGCRHHACVPEGVRRSLYLEWINAFETGSPEIDDLHRKLIQDYNSLLLLLEEDAAAWPRILAEAKKLVERCVDHFRTEERLLEQTKFPRCTDHAAEHRRLEREMQALFARMEQVDGSLREHREYPKALGPALIDVIIRHDLDYRSHLLHQQGR
jgi:hemerythrin-like metal-binding protein